MYIGVFTIKWVKLINRNFWTCEKKILTQMTDTFMVQRADHNHNYDLRNEGDLRVPYSMTEGYRRSFYPSTSTIGWWNELSIQIRNSPSLPNFKCQLRGIMFPKPNPPYSFGLGRAPVHLARFRRMGLSDLNQHRHSYHYMGAWMGLTE